MTEKKYSDLPPMFVRLKDEKRGVDCVYPKTFKPEVFSSALDYEADPSDVFVCSFAKSGTTWLQYIVWLIIRRGEDLPPSQSLSDAIPMLEFDGCSVTKAIPNDRYPRIVKSHFRRYLVPYNVRTKYIYIARNPKDVVVSYLFHIRGFGCYEAPDLQMKDLFPAFAQGEVEFGNHTEHVAEWYSARNDENVLFLLYEDLQEDPEAEVVKIAEFLGEEYRVDLLKDDKRLLKEVLSKSAFSSMSQAPDSKWVKSERKGTKFVRKGIVGDHKNHLTAEQIKVLEDVMKDKGSKLGISHLWKDYR